MMSRIEDLSVFAELVEDEESQDAIEVRKELQRIEQDYERLEIETLLSGEHDSSNAMLK